MSFAILSGAPIQMEKSIERADEMTSASPITDQDRPNLTKSLVATLPLGDLFFLETTR
jgi:hypothetical protein